jgi:hypothetical protein
MTGLFCCAMCTATIAWDDHAAQRWTTLKSITFRTTPAERRAVTALPQTQECRAETVLRRHQVERLYLGCCASTPRTKQRRGAGASASLERCKLARLSARAANLCRGRVGAANDPRPSLPRLPRTPSAVAILIVGRTAEAGVPVGFEHVSQDPGLKSPRIKLVQPSRNARSGQGSCHSGYACRRWTVAWKQDVER